METLFIGKNLLFLTEIESTNTYAMDLLRNVNLPEGSVIYTDNQTKGKGQRGAVWSSENGKNVTASVVLKPSFLGAEKAFYLSKISALSVYDVLADILPTSQYDIKIKWPNDILVNNKKIAGILIENTHYKNNIQNCIIGIGININQTNFEHLNETVTSLKKIVNQELNRDDVLKNLCSKLEKWYIKLRENKLERINEEYLRHLFGLNQKIKFIKNDILFYGEILGVDEAGKIKICTNGNEISYFELKEIKFDY